jgi:hypothetical protein
VSSSRDPRCRSLTATLEARRGELALRPVAPPTAAGALVGARLRRIASGPDRSRPAASVRSSTSRSRSTTPRIPRRAGNPRGPL